MSRLIRYVVLLVCVASSAATAQQAPMWEIRSFAGAAMPIGTQRNAFNDAMLVGSQASLWLTPTIDVVSSLAWQPSRTKYQVDTKSVDVWRYDIGGEKAFRNELAHGGQLVPLIGAGFGGRAYHFHDSTLGGSTCFSAYGTAGVQYETQRTAARLSVRGDGFCYTSPLTTAGSETRADVSVLFGVGYRF